MLRTAAIDRKGCSCRNESLSAYLSGLSAHGPITPEEEHLLALRYRRTGDPEAAKLLVLSNLRYVVKVAMGYRRYGCDLNELVQEGNLGLAEALERFDPDMGNRLITYASFWIRERMRRRIARDRSVTARGTTRAERKLGGEDPDGIRPKPDVPLDRTDPARMTSEQCPERALMEKERTAALRQAVADGLDRLDPRERRIARARYMADRPASLSAIGRQLGISRERVRQLAERVRRKLRARLLRSGFKSASCEVG